MSTDLALLNPIQLAAAATDFLSTFNGPLSELDHSMDSTSWFDGLQILKLSKEAKVITLSVGQGPNGIAIQTFQEGGLFLSILGVYKRRTLWAPKQEGQDNSTRWCNTLWTLPAKDSEGLVYEDCPPEVSSKMAKTCTQCHWNQYGSGRALFPEKGENSKACGGSFIIVGCLMEEIQRADIGGQKRSVCRPIKDGLVQLTLPEASNQRFIQDLFRQKKACQIKLETAQRARGSASKEMPLPFWVWSLNNTLVTKGQVTFAVASASWAGVAFGPFLEPLIEAQTELHKQVNLYSQSQTIPPTHEEADEVVAEAAPAPAKEEVIPF